MKVQLSLFGPFRVYDADAIVEFELADDACIADLRAALAHHAGTLWRGFDPRLLCRSAFADAHMVLRDSDPLPADGQIAVLPPVNGG